MTEDLHVEQPNEHHELNWPVAEIPNAEQPTPEPVVVPKPDRLDLTEKEEHRREVLEDAAGMTAARSYAAATGRELDQDTLLRAARHVNRSRQTHRRMPTRGSDGDTGINDPYFAGDEEDVAATEEALNAMHMTNEAFRLQRMEREINQMIKDGMRPDKARIQVEALERARQDHLKRELGR